MNYVFDLNAVRTAWTGESPSGEPSLQSGILFAEIIEICSKIVVTDEIEKRYWHLFDELKRGSRQSPRAVNIINLYTIARQGRKVDASRLSSDLAPLSDESSIKDEDREFSRLASVGNCTLITYDEPLREALQKLGVSTETPREALTRLRAAGNT